MTQPHLVRLGSSFFDAEVLDLPHGGQDAWLLGDDVLGVADGATPLRPGDIDPAELAQHALDAVARHRDLPLTAAVAEALREVPIASPTETDDRSTLSPSVPSGTPVDAPLSTRAPLTTPSQPSAAAIWARVCGDVLELASLGDCRAIASFADGSVAELTADRALEAIDRAALDRIAAAVADGADLATARERESAASPQPELMNVVGGYWIFAADPAAADHLQLAEWPLDSLEQLLLCSDGFARLIEPFAVADSPAALLTLCETTGLAELGRLLRERELEMSRAEELDVFKSHDDVTAIYLRRPH